MKMKIYYITKLYLGYKEAKKKALDLQNTKEWANASSPELFPKNLCDFLGRGSNLVTIQRY